MVIFSRHLITIQQAYETTPLTENRISNDKSKLEQCTCYCLQKKFNLCINASHSCSCHKGLSLCPPWCFESRTMQFKLNNAKETGVDPRDLQKIMDDRKGNQGVFKSENLTSKALALHVCFKSGTLLGLNVFYETKM